MLRTGKLARNEETESGLLGMAVVFTTRPVPSPVKRFRRRCQPNSVGLDGQQCVLARLHPARFASDSTVAIDGR